MKITSVECYLGDKGLGGFVTVKVNTDEGISGFGEAGLAYGKCSEAAFGQCQDFARMVLGMDPFNTEEIWEHLHRHTFWGMGGGVVVTSAMAAIDTACWDIKGKALNMPVYKLIGGKTNKKLRAYASQLQFGWRTLIEKNDALTLLYDPKDYYDVVKDAMAEGYDAVKIDPVFAPLEERPMAEVMATQGNQIRGCYREHDLTRSVERIAAAREAGRDPAGVQLCAACKTRTADTVAASAALAIDVFGENHVQELCANFDAGAYCGKPSHFIGHLQTNKIKKVLGRASLIQSVDSEHLLTAIEKEAAKAGIVQDVLLEVNIGGEASKSGVSPEQLWPLLDAAAAEEHIRVKGLMAIPPVNDDDAQNRRYLAEVYRLFVQAGERGYANVKMETLSMGMSGDFENAIREGATLVRIGTAIYGERDYSKK